jgi:two-component system cell cycle sensor histidine kinase/response regulator CckA
MNDEDKTKSQLMDEVVYMRQRLAELEKTENDRRHAEVALLESEERYRMLFDNAGDAIFIHDELGRILDVNQSACEGLGYTRDELTSMTVHQVDTSEHGRFLRYRTSRLMEEGQLTFETEHQRKDGSSLSIEVSARRITWNGKPAIMGICRDIGYRKQIEEELREKEKRYRVLFEAANDGIFLFGQNGFVDCNEKGASMYGLRKEEVIGRSPEDLSPKIQPDGRLSSVVAANKIQAAMNGYPQSFEWQSLHSSGVPFNVEVTLNRVEMGGNFQLQAIVRDITERIKAEEDLKASEERFRLAWDTIPDALSIGKLESGTYVDVNNGFTLLSGYSKEEVVGRSGLDIGLWARPGDRESFLTALGKHGHIRNYETELIGKNGESRTILLSAGIMNLGEEQHLLAIGKDIEDIKRAEEALRVSEEKYRKVVETAHDGIFIAQDGFIKFPNPQLAIVSGYSLEDLSKKPFLEFVHPDDLELVATTHERRMKGESVPNTYSFKAINKSGDTVWVELSSAFLRWEGRPASLNFLRDITRQKRLEAQLAHAQKMEAVGTLADGIAHDFNNLLQAVQGYTELLLRRDGESARGRQELEQIRRAAMRGADLTRQLLTFSRKIESSLAPLDLNRIVEDVRSLLERTIPKIVKIELKLADNLERVNADASQVEQILMNLALNARDAMPEGGTLRIETRNVIVGKESSRNQPDLTPGSYVLLTVCDTGQGMTEATLENIFDPFFTTKEVGKGTGLGLAMVYGLVKNHDGHILCASRPGEGATFEIYLPSVRRP